MGIGGRMDCCGQFVKYSMFISNFIIFVSPCIKKNFQERFRKFIAINPKLVLKIELKIVFNLHFVLNVDWWCNCFCNGSLDAGRQEFLK